MATKNAWSPPPTATAEDIVSALILIEKTLDNIRAWAGELYANSFERDIRSGLIAQSPIEGIAAAGTARRMSRVLRELIEKTGESAPPAAELAARIQGEYIEPIQDMRRAGVRTVRNGLRV